jgi:hypothetical protein
MLLPLIFMTMLFSSYTPAILRGDLNAMETGGCWRRDAMSVWQHPGRKEAYEFWRRERWHNLAVALGQLLQSICNFLLLQSI